MNNEIPLFNVVLTILVIFLTFSLITFDNIEKFESTKKINSIPADISFIPRYQNAYYFQPDNKDYIDSLKRVLGGVCQSTDFPDGEWLYNTDNDPAYVKGLYIQLYQNVVDSVIRVDHQRVVRDRIRRFMFLEDGILFDVEFLLHTEGKPFAKHISLNALVEKNEKIVIKDITLIGNVSESDL